MKIAVIIVRILMGILFAVPFLLFVSGHMNPPPLTGNAKLFMDGMQASGYLMPLLMGTQFVCALAFLIGRFVPLATVVIFPVVVNILLYHICVDPKELA